MTQATHGVFHLASLAAPTADVTVDLAKCTKTTELLRQLGKALTFPDWYGANFDALFDCLSEQDAPSRIRLTGLHAYAEQQAADFAVFVEVLLAACEARADADAPLTVWLDAPAPGLPRWPGAQ